VGADEAVLAGTVEAAVKYHPSTLLFLTTTRKPGVGPRLVGSLTGAVAS
jgi:hypothetical protein